MKKCAKKKTYVIRIRETLEKRVYVEAKNSMEAYTIAKDNYNNVEDDYILNSDDFADVNFTIMGYKKEEIGDVQRK